LMLRWRWSRMWLLYASQQYSNSRFCYSLIEHWLTIDMDTLNI